MSVDLTGFSNSCANEQRMLSMFQEKVKELDIKNIYSNRILKPPHKLNTSVSSSPAVPQYRNRKHSDPLLNTSRIRAKRYEQQRREDQRVHEVSARLDGEHSLFFTKDRLTNGELFMECQSLYIRMLI